MLSRLSRFGVKRTYVSQRFGSSMAAVDFSVKQNQTIANGGPAPFILQLAPGEFPSAETVQEHIRENGHIIVRGCEFSNAAEMREKYQYMIGREMKYDYGTNHRQDIGKGVLNVGIEPPFLNLEQHNAMAYTDSWPTYFLLGCVNPPAVHGTGVTTFADNRKIMERMPDHLREKLMEVGVRYHRRFSTKRNPPPPELFYKFWEDNFLTDDKDEATRQCVEKNLTPTWYDDDSMSFYFDRPAFIEHPKTGETIFWAQIVSFLVWFDHWSPFNKIPTAQRPIHISYADGTEFGMADVIAMKNIMDDLTTGEPWRQGDILVVENHYSTHGRTPYDPKENRVIGIMMGEKVNRVVRPLDPTGINKCVLDLS